MEGEIDGLQITTSRPALPAPALKACYNFCSENESLMKLS
jgi:hypothetical protein